MDNTDFARLESKVDKMAEAINKLVVLEERLVNQGARIGQVEQSITAITVAHNNLKEKVDAWINRGIGIWAIVLVAWTIYSKVIK
jgi:hypothetical protein